MQRNIYTLDGRQLSDKIPDEVLNQSLAVAKYYHPDVFELRELVPRSATFYNGTSFSIDLRLWDGTCAMTHCFIYSVEDNGAITLKDHVIHNS